MCAFFLFPCCSVSVVICLFYLVDDLLSVQYICVLAAVSASNLCMQNLMKMQWLKKRSSHMISNKSLQSNIFTTKMLTRAYKVSHRCCGDTYTSVARTPTISILTGFLSPESYHNLLSKTFVPLVHYDTVHCNLRHLGRYKRSPKRTTWQLQHFS